MKRAYLIAIIIIVIAAIVFILARGGARPAAVTAPDRSAAEAGAASGDMHGMPGMDMSPQSVPEGYNQPVTDTAAPVKSFTVSGQNFSFTPNAITVNKGDHVKITFTNAGGFHNLRLDEFKVSTDTIKTGESQTIDFIADQAGTFQYYCSVGTHRQMGMWGTLTVK